MKTIGRLHVITDTVLQNRFTHRELAALAIRGGADTIQYRSKSASVRTLLEEAAAVRDVCREHGVTFIVNDRVDIALAVDADGVHLGRSDMPVETARRLLGPDRIVGGTVRNGEHLREAERLGADYVGLGPVFETGSKRVDHEVLGLDLVREVCRHARIPVIAIAGITISTAAAVMAAGVYGIAVIGAVAAADHPADAAADLVRCIGGGGG
ncbi:MAG TPA: thiamine phosphate synthase [Candidatus Kapabacteria bacterium]|nr:thiamine phosphate synthase [Candidatus Kapabacteria bacterium]